MKFAPTFDSDLDREPWASATASQIGTWLRLSVYCHAKESEGTISPQASARAWLTSCRVTPEEIEDAVRGGLCRWEPNGDLWVIGYDHAGQEKYEQRRKAGAMGGRPRGSSTVENHATKKPVLKQSETTREPTLNPSPLLPSPSLPFPSPADPDTTPPDGGDGGFTNRLAERPPDRASVAPVQASLPAIPMPARPLAPARATERAPKAPGAFDRFLALFAEIWRVQYRKAYLVTASDRQHAGAIMQRLTPEELLEMRVVFEAYLRDRTPFLVKQGHSLTYLCTAGRINAYRAAAGPARRSAYPEIRGGLVRDE